MTQSNAAHTEQQLREKFFVKENFSELLEQDSTSWVGHITAITDLTSQVIEVTTTLTSREDADQAARAILSIVGLGLPTLLGIQITGQNGATLHQRDRSSMIGLNHPLGVGLPKDWNPTK